MVLMFCVLELLASCEAASAWPRFKACSFPSDSHSSWGTEIESCCVGSKKKSWLWTVFIENITRKEFPQEPSTGFSTSVHLWGRDQVGEGRPHQMCGCQHVFQGSLIFSVTVTDGFVFQMHDLKIGQIPKIAQIVSEVKLVLG